MKKAIPFLAMLILVFTIAPFTLPSAFAASQLIGASHQGESAPQSTLYSINPDTGAGVAIGLIGFDRCNGLVHHAPSGQVVAVCDDPITQDETLVEINVVTGQGTAIGLTGDILADLFFHQDITICPNQVIFGHNGIEVSFGQLTTINRITGQATNIGDTSIGFLSGHGLACSFDSTLFLSVEDEFHTLNSVTGASLSSILHTFPAPLPGSADFPRINTMAFDSCTGKLFGGLNDGFGGNPLNSLVTINPSTAVVSTVGQTVDGLSALTFIDPCPVGGELLPIDTAALMLAGIQSSVIWMLPVLVGIVGAGAYYMRTRMSPE